MKPQTDTQNLEQECREILLRAGELMIAMGYEYSATSRVFPGIAKILDWLTRQPGETWQERWLAGEPHVIAKEDIMGRSIRKTDIRMGLNILLGLEFIRPTYDFLLFKRRTGATIFTEEGEIHPDHALILEIAKKLKYSGGLSSSCQQTYFIIALHTGKKLNQFNIEDLELYVSAWKKHRKDHCPFKALYNIMLELGIISDEAIEKNRRLKRFAITPEELVQKHGMADTPWQLPFQVYFQERSATCNLVTLMASARNIMTVYWKEILAIDPDIKSFDVKYATIMDWKAKVKLFDAEQERLALGHIYIDVKSFYDFLTMMAREEPEVWAVYEPKSPITTHEINAVMKETNRRRADVRDETALVLPYLKTIRYELMRNFIVKRSILIWSQHATLMDEAEFDGVTYVKREFAHATQAMKNRFNTYLVSVHIKDHPSKIVNPGHGEDTAFLLWVIFEFLYLTGLRVGELMNLLVSDISVGIDEQGNTVPVLSVKASKTDSPRISSIPPRVSELIDIIKTRVKDGEKTYPSTARYDRPTRKYITRQKLLIQKTFVRDGHAVDTSWFSSEFKRFLNQLRAEGKIPRRVSLVPREIRRIFATLLYRKTRDLLKVARVLGHKNLEVTKMYIIHDRIDAVDLDDF